MSHKELLKVTLDNGITLAYRLSHPIDKSLETIVMFHSFLMDSRLYTQQFKDDRYSAYNLIAVDAHGHGGTTGRGKDFTYWDTASDSLQLLTKLGLDCFYVLGTSQGGFIGFRMALLEPQRIKGLILEGTSAYAESEEDKIKFGNIRDKWCETEIPTEEAFLAKAASFGGPTRIGEKAYEKVKQMWIERHLGHEGYDPAINCLFNRDGIEDKLQKITTAALVLHGTDDKAISLEEAKDWSSKLPNLWRFEIVDRGMHYLSFREPGDEACAKLIPTFIKETCNLQNVK